MTTGDDGRFVPGMTIAGRYRLLDLHGGRPLLQFWHAVDVASGQDVALTLVDAFGELPEEFVHEILARTIRLRGLGMPGVASVLEVLHTGAFGVVVSEWIPGGSLWQVADTAPAPDSAAIAMQSLAAAAEAAHRAGLVLSVDDPGRLRVNETGQAVLAFPANLPEATVRSDLRGIGRALYALLLNRLPDDSAGQPVEPAAVKPAIPFLISTTVAALLRDNDGISSAATLLTLLRQAGAAEESDCRIMPPLPPPPPGGYADFRNFGPDEQKDAARRLVIRTGLVAAATVLLVAVLALASSLNGILGTNDDTVAMDADKLGLVPQTPVPAPPEEETKAVRGVAPGERVPLEAAGVFSPDGSPDSPGDAGLAIDGKPDTSWATDRYYDADPFPKFKSGVGLLVSLREPMPINAVTVDLNGTGTVLQVRSAENPEPKTLEDTIELSPPTPVQPGSNRIPITDARPVSRVVVWISKLGSADGQNQVAISEIGVHAASAPA